MDHLNDEYEIALEQGEVVADEMTALRDRTAADAKAWSRRAAWVAWLGVFVPLLIVAYGLSFPFATAKDASAIQLEYFTGVAGIAPVLLVAGFVELAVIRLRHAVPFILSFAIPTISAGVAALDVLATHRGTPSTLLLTQWGLGVAVFLLIVYVCAHATMDPA